MKHLIFTTVFCFFSIVGNAQLDFAKGFGGQIGFSVNMGTHFNRMGIMLKLYYHYEYVQANVQLAAYYNARSFPIGVPSWEGQLKVGVVAAFGQKDSIYYNPFVNEISNQTSRPFSIGYSYNFYLDDIKTSQLTGTIGFGIYNFNLLMENDFMAFLQEDKFRSGAIAVYYRLQNTQISLCHIAWTADPYAKGTVTLKTPDYPAKYGYRKMQHVEYSSHSAGVLAFKVEQSMGFGQYIGASIGIDADQIRNAFQNKLIHDSFLLKDPHVPMIDREGNTYLFKEGQKIRVPQFYFQVQGNTGSLY